MSDAAIIEVKSDGRSVCLYTHCTGTDLPRILRDALALHERWDQPAYLARIILCRMVPPEMRESTTGFAIGPRPWVPYGCSVRTLWVDIDRREVAFVDEYRKLGHAQWSFEEFAKLSDEECSHVWTLYPAEDDDEAWDDDEARAIESLFKERNPAKTGLFGAVQSDPK